MSLKVPNGFVIDQEAERSESVITFNSITDDAIKSQNPRNNEIVTIPVLPKSLAIFCLVANIVVPGSGTCVCGFMIFCFNDGKEEFYKLVKIFLSNVLMALCQMATAILVIGWLWSIIWGCAIVGHSSYFTKDSPSVRKILPTPSITLDEAQEINST